MADFRNVYWGQGTFLTPQHFQTAQRSRDAIQQYLWERSCAHGWGFRKLRLRDQALLAGTLEVADCEFISRQGDVLRAGTEATVPNGVIPPRALGDLLRGQTQVASLFLALGRHEPRVTSNPSDVTFDGKSALPPRYLLKSEKRPDALDPEGQDAEVVLVHHVASVVCSVDPAFSVVSQGAELIKFAEVLPGGGVAIKLSTDFIPASVEIGASTAALKIVKDVRDLIVSRAAEFSAFKRQRGARAYASSAQDVLRIVILQALSRYAPLLQHCVEQASTAPESVYKLLRQLVGELSALSEGFDFLGVRAGSQVGLPVYDHTDIRGCFRAAVSLIQEAVNLLAPGPETGIKLVHDGKLFKAEIPAAALDGERTRFYIVIDSEVRGADLWTRLQRTGKVSTVEDMPKLLQAALFGLKIDPLPHAPEELPQKGGNLSYFQIDTRHPIWTTIRQRRNIAMYCDLNPADTAITLISVGAAE
jgi:type VI secretion system ImpJ/VasE family protein